MLKRKVFLMVMIILGVLVTGCSSKSHYESQSSPEAQVEYDQKGDYGVMEEMDVDAESMIAENSGPKRNQNQKLIYRANIQVEVIQKVTPLIDTLQKFVEEHNGYIESMEQYRRGYDPVTQEELEGVMMRIRIPHEYYNKTLNTIAELGSVINRSSSVEDVTLQYSDIESTLKMYKIEQDRLLEMLKDEKVAIKDMIEIEKRLSEVRVEIEKQESAKRALESQINYDTIDLEIDQVRRTIENSEPKSFGSRMKSTFIQSIDDFIVFTQNLVLSLTAMLIPIGVLIIIGGILYLPISKLRKHRKNRPDRVDKRDDES